MSTYYIDGTKLSNIANAIRNMRQETGGLTPDQMVTKISNSRMGVPVDAKAHDIDHWVRPEGYPDLDALYETIGSNESCLYFTYDLTKTPGYGWIGLCAQLSGGSFYVERGHIEDGAFVSDWSSSAITSAGYFRQDLDSANGNVQLWRLSTDKNILKFGFVPNTSTDADNFMNNVQPCVERCGKMPYATNLASAISTSSTALCFGTSWLERDNVLVGTNSVVLTLSGMYYLCSSLVETSCTEWDTSNWAVYSIGSMFSGCHYLQNLDLSGWDTSNWAVTAMYGVWEACFSLKTLDVSTWDTSNWAVTNFSSSWNSCYSLRELDLSSWDVSAWRPTTLINTWANCFSLRKLDVSTWDTSDWTINNLSGTWTYCTALEKLDIGNWDTSSWTVTTLANTWSYCLSLRELDLSKWTTSSWAVTSMSSTWYSCESLTSLNISTWNTSNWAVNTLASTWNLCCSLKELDINNWVTTNWVVTTLSGTWASCHALNVLKIGNLNTSNWVVSSLQQAWYRCYSLKKLVLNSWDTSNWPVTNMYATFGLMSAAEEIDISSWSLTKFALTDTRLLYDGTQARILKLPAGLHGSVANAKYTSNIASFIYFSGIALDIDMNYSGATKLTHDSLVSIIDRLPTVGSTKTLTIGQTNKLKLTAAEIAVATQKGWTVA